MREQSTSIITGVEKDVAILPGSFRDPAGVVFFSHGVLHRQVNINYQEHYDLLIDGGLYDELSKRHWLVSHEEMEAPVAYPGCVYRILRPERVIFASYPYEWCFSQLKDAALLTLDVQRAALEHGMTLKDASAYNVQFHNGRPILIDTLSFERYAEGEPWIGYRQFCQHFLAPLALMAKTDVRLNQLLRVYIDGMPLDLASDLLPRRTWLTFGLATHLHIHARAQKAFSSSDKRLSPGPTTKVSKRGLVGLVEGLRSLVARLEWRPRGTEWADYYRATNYSDSAFEAKRNLVEIYLKRAAPREVWDLGANVGAFSRIASRLGIPTVAFDIDPAAVEVNYRTVKEQGETLLLPLVLDLTNPSPGLGWHSNERDSIISRSPGDCAMALALIHHLAISNNVPLGRIAAFLGEICRSLIIEFVPKSDSQVQRLLRSRKDIFEEYDQSHFERAFSDYFEIQQMERIEGSERMLYLMKKRGG